MIVCLVITRACML